MEQTFPAFVDYMEKERHSSASTVMSYQRDVRRMITFLENKGISDAGSRYDADDLAGSAHAVLWR